MDTSKIQQTMAARPGRDQLAVSAMLAALLEVLEGGTAETISLHPGELRVTWAPKVRATSPQCPREKPCATVGFHAADECTPESQNTPCCAAPRLSPCGDHDVCLNCAADRPKRT